MSRLELAAIRLHDLIWKNTGESNEWPLQFLCDEELYDEFAYALNELGDAVEEVKPGSKPWPISV